MGAPAQHVADLERLLRALFSDVIDDRQMAAMVTRLAELVDAVEAAGMLGRTPASVYQYASEGKLTAYVVGGKTLFVRSEVEDFRSNRDVALTEKQKRNRRIERLVDQGVNDRQISLRVGCRPDVVRIVRLEHLAKKKTAVAS